MAAQYPALGAALAEFSARMDQARQTLYYCDVSFMQKARLALRQELQAGTYVTVAAALEVFVTEALSAVVDEINALGLPHKDLRLSLFAMVRSNDLEALQAIRGLKMWARRTVVFTSVDANDVCSLSSEQVPLDGHTIRPVHLETIWAVFGLAGTHLPSPRHSFALKDLADGRNDLAHGSERAHAVAGRKSVEDTLKLVEQVEDVALHVYDAMDDYLNGAKFLR